MYAHLSRDVAVVMITAICVVSGLIVLMDNTEDSEAVTTYTIEGKVVNDCYTLFNNASGATYYVANGTYINITATQDGDDAYGIKSNPGISGLTFSGQSLTGTITQTSYSSTTITVFQDDTVSGSYHNTITFTLCVMDMTSSSTSPFSRIACDINVAYANAPLYLVLDGSVDITSITYNGNIATAYSVTGGTGLYISGTNLTGQAWNEGTATVVVSNSAGDNSEFQIIIINPSTTTGFRMIAGETYTYTPTVSVSGGTYTLSGTSGTIDASSYSTLSSGTITFTAPTPSAIGEVYGLTITYTTANPAQTVYQYINFTVDPAITCTNNVSDAVTIVAGTAGTADTIASNFNDGSRSIYSISGGTATGFSVSSTSGALTYSNPTAGTVIVTAASPYTYSSGATNTASTTITVTVTNALAIAFKDASDSAVSTIYLVTGGSVPNTASEIVIPYQTDGPATATYVWSIEGTNNTGITISGTTSTATLGGTALDPGTYTITVQCVATSNGLSQTAAATLNVVIVNVLLFTSSPSIGTFS